MANKYKILKDEEVEQEVRYLSFMGNFRRYDFAIMNARDNNKKVVIDLRNNRFAVLNKEDIMEEGGIEHTFHVTEIEADELREVLGAVL
ncbi:cytoplasmic protein [Virgibacillus phasianinus]|uniref:Cytoplasmic protein n=1 Tax=Virgibacillus phasianinus TaxID=2017483 RepID=A0A220U4V1_9BACI|nr:SAV0927 family protein [Virgibacillus phasianinus]ASK62861.1 cytoplasmic protein [Virgibacillus phasianinus]